MHTKLKSETTSEFVPKRTIFQNRRETREATSANEYAPPTAKETIRNIVTGAILAEVAGEKGEVGKTVDFSRYNNSEDAFAAHYRKVFSTMPSHYDEKLFFSSRNPYLEDLITNVHLEMPLGKSIDDLEKVEFSKSGDINLAYRMQAGERGFQWVKIKLGSNYHKAIAWIREQVKPRPAPTKEEVETKVQTVVARRRELKRSVAADVIADPPSSAPTPREPQEPTRSVEYPRGTAIDQATIEEAAKEAATKTGDINKVLERENFIKVVNYVAETVGIPASAILSTMFTETRFRFDPNLRGPGGEYGLGQFMPGTWKTIRKTSAFKSCVSKFEINPATVERAENLLADITGIAVLLKRGISKDIDHTTQLTADDLEQMRFHYHVPGYRRAIMEGRGSEAYKAKARAFIEKNKARKASKYGDDGVGKYGYLYFAKNAEKFQRAWEAKFASRSNITKETPMAAATRSFEKYTGLGSSDFEYKTKGEVTTIKVGGVEIKATGKIENGAQVELKEGGKTIKFNIKNPKEGEYEITVPDKPKVKLSVKIKGLGLRIKYTDEDGTEAVEEFNLMTIDKIAESKKLEEFFKKYIGLSGKEMLNKLKRIPGVGVDAKETKPSTEIKSEKFTSPSKKPGKYHLKSGQKRWIVGTSSVVGNLFSKGEKYDGMATSLTDDSGYYGVSSEHPDKFLNGFKKEIEPKIEKFEMPGEVIIVGLGYMGAMAGKTADQIMESYKKIESYYKSKGVASVKFTTVQPYAAGTKLNTINEFNKLLLKTYETQVINTLDLSTDANKHTDGFHLNDAGTKTLAARIEGIEEK